MMAQGIEIVTIDRRGRDVYSASFYIKSDSRPGLKHHVTLWFEYLIEEDFDGRITNVIILNKKYSCTCEYFTFRGLMCKHVERAIYTLKDLIKERGGLI
jgi:hypothetical protein